MQFRLCGLGVLINMVFLLKKRWQLFQTELILRGLFLISIHSFLPLFFFLMVLWFLIAFPLEELTYFKGANVVIWMLIMLADSSMN